MTYHSGFLNGAGEDAKLKDRGLLSLLKENQFKDPNSLNMRCLRYAHSLSLRCPEASNRSATVDMTALFLMTRENC